MKHLTLEPVKGPFAICRLEPDADVPGWAGAAPGFATISRSDRELSIVAPSAVVPDGVRAERDWVGWRVAGTLDFAVTGVLASLTGALADADIPVFAVSTYDTDYLFVRARDESAACHALAAVASI